MPDGVADAYLTRPDDGDRHPGVLFIMDAYGLRPRIEDMADRIAERGYAVLAPNVFYRAGRSPVIPFPDMTRENARTEFFGQVRPLMAELTPERLAADGAAYLDELAKVADEPIAITGYCMGVRLGLRIAAAHPGRVAALAGFHGGGLVTEDTQSPHTVAPASAPSSTSVTPTTTAAIHGSRSPRSTRPSTRPASLTRPRSTRAPPTATRWPTRRSTTRARANATSRRSSISSTARRRGSCRRPPSG